MRGHERPDPGKAKPRMRLGVGHYTGPADELASVEDTYVDYSNALDYWSWPAGQGPRLDGRGCGSETAFSTHE